jgi:hypothetical protein
MKRKQKPKERFESAMKALFQVPKSVVMDQIKKKPKKGKD